LFERLRDALRAALDAATPPGDLRDLTRQMREAVVEAKLAVEDTRAALARAERDLADERRRLADAERRGRLAAEIQDGETVEVAQRFAAKHHERVGVLEHKRAALVARPAGGGWRAARHGHPGRAAQVRAGARRARGRGRAPAQGAQEEDEEGLGGGSHERAPSGARLVP